MSDRKSATPRHTHIERHDNGGYTVRHSYDNQFTGESHRRDDTHAFADHGSTMKHVTKMTAPGGSQVSTMDKDHASNTGAQTSQSHKAKVRPAHPNIHSRGAGVD